MQHTLLCFISSGHPRMILKALELSGIILLLLVLLLLLFLNVREEIKVIMDFKPYLDIFAELGYLLFKL